MGDSVFTCFITRNLLKEGSLNNPLALKDVVFADSIAKSKLKLYNSTNFVDGLYSTYENFKNQTPDKKCVVVRKKNKLKSVNIISDNGVERPVESKDIYAVVTEGIPFIATKYGFYLLKRRNDDLVFIGKLPAPANSGGVAASMMFFGLIGGLVASELNKSSYFYSVLNYKTGESIRIREIIFREDDSEESNWYYNQ